MSSNVRGGLYCQLISNINIFWRMLKFPVTVMIHNNFCLGIYNNTKSVQSIHSSNKYAIPIRSVSKYSDKVILTLPCSLLLRMGWEGNSTTKNLV